MQIFVEHWGGLFAILPQFCPIFNIGGDEPWHDFFSGEQIKLRLKKGLLQKWNTFFPEFRWRPKKKGLHQNRTLFIPEFKWKPALRCTSKSNYWRGCKCRPYSNYWGGYSEIIAGDISPPGFGTPDSNYQRWAFRCAFFNRESFTFVTLVIDKNIGKQKKT